MDSVKIAFEPVEGLDDVVRIPLGNIKDTQFILEVLQDTFEACFQQGYSMYLVDLENIDYPSSTLVALLVEVTSRARRLHGDVKLLNLSKETRKKVETFSPTYYLSFNEAETSALAEFNIKDSEPELLTDDVPTNEVVPTEDIAEDPIIDLLENKLKENGSHQSDTTAAEGSEVAAGDHAGERKGERSHQRVKSDAQNLYSICDFITKYAERAGFNVKEVGKIKIAVYEATLNVIEHAYHSNSENWIDVWIEYNAEMFKIIIQDYGEGFEGFENKKYDVESAMADRQTGGFGLYIIRRSMDKLEYRPDPNRGNRLTMIKFIERNE